MSYAVKEIFHTLQGEGMNAGRPAVFLRFTGCNLWSGRAQDRDQGTGGCSKWCDTDFVGTDGTGGGRFETADALVAAVLSHWKGGPGSRPFVVCTGGEPLLQIDETLTKAFHRSGFETAVETNGTKASPQGIDWLCVSPKAGTELRLRSGNELKLAFPQEGAEPERFENLDFGYFLLQPIDGGAQAENTARALRYCLDHPRWRLSLQLHKFLGIR